MAKDLELALKILAQVEGLAEISGLAQELEGLDPALADVAARARAALNPMNGLADSSRNFGQSVKEATQPLADLAANSLKLTTVAAALGTALGVKAYAEAKKFESAQLDLLKVLGGTREELEGYTDQLKALALEFGASSTDLTASMAEFVQAGFSAEEALSLVRESLKLMVAGSLDAGEASNAIVRALKGFGAEASEAGRLVDILNEVSNRYATDVRQLAEGMQRVAPVAEQMGLSFEETAAVLTPMIESFGSGAEAAEAFKTGALQLINDAKPVQDALRSIGVAQTDANGRLRSGEAILYDVMRAFKGAEQEQKLFLTSQLVGIDQAPRLIKVFDNLSGVLDITTSALNANGSAQNEVNIRLQSAETIAKRTEESFSQLAIALGTNYRDAVKGVSDSTGALARAFLEVEKNGNLDALFATVRPQLQALEELFRQVAANLPEAFAQLDWSKLTGAIRDLGGEVAAAFDAMIGGIDLGTVEGLRTLLQRLADGMAALIRFTAGVVDGMGPLFTAFGQLAAFFADNAEGSARFAGEMSGLGLTLNKIIPAVASFTAETFSLIGTVAEAAFKVGLLVLAVKALNLAGISVLPIMGKLAAAIGGLSVTTATAAAAFAGFPGVMLALTAAAGGAGYAVGTVLNGALNALLEPLTGGSLGTLIYDLADSLGLTAEASARAAEQEERLARATGLLAVPMQAFNKLLRERLDAQLAIAKLDLTAAIQQEEKLAQQLQQRVRDQEFLIRTNEKAGRSEETLAGLRTELIRREAELALSTDQLKEARERLAAVENEQGNRRAVRLAQAGQENVALQDLIRNIDAATTAELNQKTALEQSAAQRAKVLESLERAADAQKTYGAELARIAAAQLNGLRTEIQLAEAKGDTATVAAKSVELAKLENQWALTLTQVKQLEIQAEIALNQAKIEALALTKDRNKEQQAELTALTLRTQALQLELQLEQQRQGLLQQQQQQIGENTQQTEQNTGALQKNTERVQENAGAVAEQSKSYTLMEDAAMGALRELSGLSAGMNALVSTMLRVNDAGDSFGHNFRGELGKLNLQLEQTNQAIQHNLRVIGPFRDAFERNVDIANAARKAYLEQAIAATELAGRLEDAAEGADTSSRALQTMVREGAGAVRGLNLLDQQTLDNLTGALEAANDRLREMQEEAQDARDRLAELNAEIAEERGEDEKAALLRQQLDYQRALAEIEAKRNQAQLEGNRELVALYDEQARKLAELNALKETNIRRDEESRKAQSANQANTTAPVGGTGTTASPAGTGAARTYNLNLMGVNGRTLPATTTADPASFLDELERARRAT